jgi:hypothetical protein
MRTMQEDGRGAWPSRPVRRSFSISGERGEGGGLYGIFTDHTIHSDDVTLGELSTDPLKASPRVATPFLFPSSSKSAWRSSPVGSNKSLASMLTNKRHHDGLDHARSSTGQCGKEQHAKTQAVAQRYKVH